MITPLFGHATIAMRWPHPYCHAMATASALPLWPVQAEHLVAQRRVTPHAHAATIRAQLLTSSEDRLALAVGEPRGAPAAAGSPGAWRGVQLMAQVERRAELRGKLAHYLDDLT